MLEINKIVKEYDRKVLDEISFSVEKGTICGLFGLNGAGKSTLLKILCGLEKQNSGQILFDGKEIILGKYPKIGAMIESPCFFPNMTGYENLKLLSYLKKDITNESIKLALKKVGLANKSNVLVKKYSLGMKQRLYFASAIIRNVDVLLLDEPFNGIDPIALNTLELLIKELANNGTTILISSHEIRELQVLVDQVIFLDGGKIIFNKPSQGLDIFNEFVSRVSNKGNVQ